MSAHNYLRTYLWLFFIFIFYNILKAAPPSPTYNTKWRCPLLLLSFFDAPGNVQIKIQNGRLTGKVQSINYAGNLLYKIKDFKH